MGVLILSHSELICLDLLAARYLIAAMTQKTRFIWGFSTFVLHCVFLLDITGTLREDMAYDTQRSLAGRNSSVHLMSP